MRILMYGWEFPPHISGGLGTACFGLTQALASIGHRITFVLPRLAASGGKDSHVTLVGSNEVEVESGGTAGSADRLVAGNDISFERVDALMHPYINPQGYRELMRSLFMLPGEPGIASRATRLGISDDYGSNLIEEIGRYAHVAGTIAKRTPHEVIHAHDWMTIPAGLEAKRTSGRPLVVHIHSLEYDRCGDNVNPDVYAIERLGMEKADKIISVSQFTKNKIIRHYNIDPAKITVVHNAVIKIPVPATPIDRKLKTKTVLYLGRITFQKGPDYFIEAAAKVLAVRKDVRFVMSGCGDMMHRMIERTAELKIARYFHFTGFLRGPDVSRMYRMSDCYVMPSVSEPFGISPLEAMQHGVPVIISRQSGIAEAVGSVLKVDFWDVKELAGKMLAILNYAPLKKELINRANAELDRITWKRSAERIEGVYYQMAMAG